MGKWMSKQGHRRSISKSERAHFSTSSEIRSDIRENGSMKTEKPAHDFPKISLPEEAETTALATSEGKFCFSGSSNGRIVLQDLEQGSIMLDGLGHQREVTKVSSNGEYFVTASRDKTVKLWLKNGAKEIGHLIGHTLSVTAVDSNEDFSQVCSGSRDNSIKLWDVETSSTISESKISRNLVTDICWSSDLSLLAQTAEDKILKLWDPRNLRVVHSFTPQGQIQTSCSVFQDYCMTTNNGFGNQGCEISLWDLRGRKLLKTYKSHSETVSCCKILPNGGFVSCSHDGTVKLWQPINKQDALSNSELQSTVHLHSGTLTGLSVLDFEHVLCVSLGSGIRIVKLRGNTLAV